MAPAGLSRRNRRGKSFLKDHYSMINHICEAPPGPDGTGWFGFMMRDHVSCQPGRSGRQGAAVANGRGPVNRAWSTMPPRAGRPAGTTWHVAGRAGGQRLRSLGRCARHHGRRVDPEHRPLTRLAVALDVAAVLLENAVHRGQAQSRPLAHLLGGGATDQGRGCRSLPGGSVRRARNPRAYPFGQRPRVHVPAGQGLDRH